MGAAEAALEGAKLRFPADRDDLARLHPELPAAGHRLRRRLGQPPSIGTGVIGGQCSPHADRTSSFRCSTG